MSKHMDGSPDAIDASSHETLAGKLGRIEGLEAEALKLFHDGLGVPPSRDIYLSDFFLVGAAKRTLAHCAGFRAMIGARNFPCAAAVLRMQLDTGLRIFAGSLVANADDFAKAVFHGKRINTMRDRDGQKMVDAYLVQKLTHRFPWIAPVYRGASGFVHLSERHFFTSIAGMDNATRTVRFQISAQDPSRPEEDYFEVVEAFIAATRLAISLVAGWLQSNAARHRAAPASASP